MGREESLAVLQPHSTTMEPTTPDTGGGSLTAADCAHALAICRSDAGARLLMMRIGGIDCRKELHRAIMGRIMLMAIGEDWLKPGEALDRDRMDRLATLALNEHIRPHLCARCQGRGCLSIRGRRRVIEECPDCAGSGRRKPHAPGRYASQIGVTRHQWMKRWTARHASVVDWLAQAESQAIGDLITALR
jgi:hypothetical protein